MIEAEWLDGNDLCQDTHILRSFLYDEKAPGGMDLMPLSSRRLRYKPSIRKKTTGVHQ